MFLFKKLYLCQILIYSILSAAYAGPKAPTNPETELRHWLHSKTISKHLTDNDIKVTNTIKRWQTSTDQGMEQPTLIKEIKNLMSISCERIGTPQQKHPSLLSDEDFEEYLLSHGSLHDNEFYSNKWPKTDPLYKIKISIYQLITSHYSYRIGPASLYCLLDTTNQNTLTNRIHSLTLLLKSRLSIEMIKSIMNDIDIVQFLITHSPDNTAGHLLAKYLTLKNIDFAFIKNIMTSARKDDFLEHIEDLASFIKANKNITIPTLTVISTLHFDNFFLSKNNGTERQLAEIQDWIKKHKEEEIKTQLLDILFTSITKTIFTNPDKRLPKKNLPLPTSPSNKDQPETAINKAFSEASNLKHIPSRQKSCRKELPFFQKYLFLFGEEFEYTSHDLSYEEATTAWKNTLIQALATHGIESELYSITESETGLFITIGEWEYKTVKDLSVTIEINTAPYKFEEYLLVGNQRLSVYEMMERFIFNIAKTLNFTPVSGHKHIDIKDAIDGNSELLMRLYIDVQKQTWLPTILGRSEQIQYFQYAANQTNEYLNLQKLIKKLNEQINKKQFNLTNTWKETAQLVHLRSYCLHPDFYPSNKYLPCTWQHIKKNTQPPHINTAPTSTIEFRAFHCPTQKKEVIVINKMLIGWFQSIYKEQLAHTLIDEESIPQSTEHFDSNPALAIKEAKHFFIEKCKLTPKECQYLIKIEL